MKQSVKDDTIDNRKVECIKNACAVIIGCLLKVIGWTYISQVSVWMTSVWDE